MGGEWEMKFHEPGGAWLPLAGLMEWMRGGDCLAPRGGMRRQLARRMRLMRAVTSVTFTTPSPLRSHSASS